jgi:hypothetical protein
LRIYKMALILQTNSVHCRIWHQEGKKVSRGRMTISNRGRLWISAWAQASGLLTNTLRARGSGSLPAFITALGIRLFHSSCLPLAA